MDGRTDDFDDDDDALDLDTEDGEEIAELNAGADFSRKLGYGRRGRGRRNWQDVERAREERQMRRLLNAQVDWFDELDDRPRHSRR